MWSRALARSFSATTISTCPVAPTSGSRVGMSLLREKQLEFADAAGDVVAGLLPVGLGEQLAGGALRHRHQRLQLDLERIAGRDEVGEGLLQVLLAHLLAAVGHGPELGAHQRGLQIGSAHFRQVGRQHLAQIAVELHPRLLRHGAHQLEPLVVGLWIEEREVRSEEHTSELQSLAYLVCRLLLEKKKKKIITYFLLKKKKKINKL